MTTNHLTDVGNMVFGDTLQSRAYRAFNALSDLGWSICNCTGDLPPELAKALDEMYGAEVKA